MPGGPADDDHHDKAEGGRDTPDRLYRTRKRRIESYGSHKDGQEHERLKTRQYSNGDRREQQRLPAQRRPLEDACHRPRRQHEHRVEEHFCHHEP